jgi:hypothetical protein
MSKSLDQSNYFDAALNKLIRFCSPYFKKWEKPFIKKFGSQNLKHQPVFIIGAPRTGSTILYQLVTNVFDVLYIDNLACKFYKNLFLGVYLSQLIYKNVPHNVYHSRYGRTDKLHGPSECGQFWYRWLPVHKHFIDFSDITDSMVSEIRQEITSIINFFNKPFIFKNLNAGQRIRLITKCFPDAKFIWIRREPLFIVQSVLLGKRSLNIMDNQVWGIYPKDLDKIKKIKDPYEQITTQIYLLEKQIYLDRKFIQKGNLLTIQYEKFIENYEYFLKNIKNFINIRSERKIVPPSIKLNNKRKLPDHEIEIFDKIIQKYDWENFDGKE